MIIILFRLLIFIAVCFLLYTIIRFIKNPQHKLQIAKDSNVFFIIDEEDNSKKNLQFVYKGCLFEGEKYLGTAEYSFEVMNIHVSVPNPIELKGFTRDDLYFLEKELTIRYPHAEIEWKHPINKLLITTSH